MSIFIYMILFRPTQYSNVSLTTRSFNNKLYIIFLREKNFFYNYL